MYPHHLKDNTVSDLSEENDITNEDSCTIEQSQDCHLNYYASILLNDNCEEELLHDIPDILKLCESDEFNLDIYDTEQPSTSSAVKRPFADVECEPIATLSNHKRIDLNQDINNSEEFLDDLLMLAEFPVSIDSNLSDLNLVSAVDDVQSVPISTEKKIDYESVISAEDDATKSIIENNDKSISIEHYSSYHLDSFNSYLGFSDDDDLNQYPDNYEEKSSNDRLNLSIITSGYDNDKSCMYHAPKNIENEQLATISSSYLNDISHFHEAEAFNEPTETPSIIENIEQYTCKTLEQGVTSKKLELRVYHKCDLCSKEFKSNVYKNAIRKIAIDRNGLFRNSVLEEIDKLIEGKDFVKSSADFSLTYSNVRKYVLNKVSKYINSIITDADVSITAGMSISDIISSCVSNDIFFKKLSANCEEIIEDITKNSDSLLSTIFQSYFCFCRNSGDDNYKVKFAVPPRNRILFLSNSTSLVIETIRNLPQSIITEIMKFNQNDIVRGLFSEIHGVFVSNSLIRDINSFFNSTKNQIPDDNFENHLNLFSDLLGEVACLVSKYCIFHNSEVFLPNEYIVEKLSRYLLSDMYGIHISLCKKIKMPAKKSLKLQESSASINMDIQSPKLSLNTSNTEIVKTTLKLKIYRRINFHPIEFSGNIYEYAVKKINIDDDGLFKDSLLTALNNIIVNRRLDESRIDISLTYSNALNYISSKIHLSTDIIPSTDVPITYGMSLSDIISSCVSNHAFLKDELPKICEEAVKDISMMDEKSFSDIIQCHIGFGSSYTLNIFHKKNRICSKAKEFILHTIRNLPQSISLTIKEFKKNDIINIFFSEVHGVFISRSSISSLNSFFNSHNHENNRFSNSNFSNKISLFNSLLAELVDIIKISCVFHEGKVVLLDESTVEVLSKRLLSDMFGVPAKFHKKLKPSYGNMAEPTESNSDISLNYLDNTKYSITDTCVKNIELIPKINSRWKPDLVTSLNIYQFSISIINFDKGRDKFENSFADKFLSSLVVDLNARRNIKFDFSKTYGRVKNYIIEIFRAFSEEIQEETKVKINLYHGMTLSELESAYISNEKFFTKLHEFCNKTIISIENCKDNTLIDMMQYTVKLETEIAGLKEIMMERYKKISISKNIAQLLIDNISAIPKIIKDTIKLLPRSNLIEEYFSSFYNIYVDNVSLLKAKLVFDNIHKKIINDEALSSLLGKNFLGGTVDKKKSYKIINSNIVCGMSTFNYIRHLAREEYSSLRENMGDSIMIVRHNIIEIADENTKNKILDKLESDLIEVSIKLYRDLCFSQCKSKI